MEIGESLASTPTWAVAVVCSVLILLSLLIEHALHLLGRFVQTRKRKTLNQAVNQLKAELRSLGFMSLLITMAKQPISKICISKELVNTFLPCKLENSFYIDDGGIDTCAKEGKVPLISSEGTIQLQMLIFVITTFHVISCLFTLSLGAIKMRRWESWEEETRTLEHQLSNDSRRFKFARQTSFGQRHLKSWSSHCMILWPVCFLRQFTDSVSKVDYFALRNGFIRIYFSKDTTFNFHRFIRRSLDQDFVMIVRISAGIWLYALLIIFFNADRVISYVTSRMKRKVKSTLLVANHYYIFLSTAEFHSHYWLPFIPLVMLLIIGTKLEVVITKLCLETNKERGNNPRLVPVKPDDNLFWFGQPKLILHVIHFILIQNSFQLALFTWAWYKFGFRSCFHKEVEDIILTLGVGILVQFLCAYVTLPLYALVTQMGSSMQETVFSDDIIAGLKRWHRISKKTLSKKKSISASPSEMDVSSSNAWVGKMGKPMKETVFTNDIVTRLKRWHQISKQTLSKKKSISASSSVRPSTVSRIDGSSSNSQSLASRFKYPSGRIELLEIQKIAEKRMGNNNSPFDGEISFRLWKKQGGPSKANL